MITSVFFTVLQVFTMFFHCFISNYKYFVLFCKCVHCFTSVYNCFPGFYKCLQLFLHCLRVFCLSLFYLATINGCCCYNALREKSLTIQVFTTVFHCFISVNNCVLLFFKWFNFYKRLQLFSTVLQMFTTVFTLFYKFFLSLFIWLT